MLSKIREVFGFTGPGDVSQETRTLGVMRPDMDTQREITDVLDTPTFEKYEKMRRTDAQIRSVIRNVRLPILSATYQIVSEDDEHKAYAERQVGLSEKGDNNIEWSPFLRDITSHMDLGFYLGEPQYGIINGRYQELLGVHFRPQSSILKFIPDERGQIVGAVQQTLQGEVIMPHVFHLAFDAEGNDPKGFPLLESIVNDYDDKQSFRRYARIQAQRFALGIPIISHDPNASTSEIASYNAMIKSYLEGDLGGGALPNTIDFDVKGLEGGDRWDNTPYIRYADEQIAKNYLSMLIELGTSVTGSRAVGSNFITNFFNAEKAIADHIVKGINDKLLCPLLIENFRESDARLEVSEVLPEDESKRMELVEAFISAGIIPKDPAIIEHVLKTLELPDVDPRSLIPPEPQQPLEREDLDVA